MAAAVNRRPRQVLGDGVALTVELTEDRVRRSGEEFSFGGELVDEDSDGVVGAPGDLLALKRSGLNDFGRVGLQIEDGEIAGVLTGGGGGVADNGQLLRVIGGDVEDLNGACIGEPKAMPANGLALAVGDDKVGVRV